MMRRVWCVFTIRVLVCMSVRLVGSSAAWRKSWRRSHFSSRHSNRMKSHLVFLSLLLLCSYTQAVPQPQYGKLFWTLFYLTQIRCKERSPWTLFRMDKNPRNSFKSPAGATDLDFSLLHYSIEKSTLCMKQASKARLSTWKSMLLLGKRGQKLSVSVLHVIFWGHQKSKTVSNVAFTTCFCIFWSIFSTLLNRIVCHKKFLFQLRFFVFHDI